MNNGLSWDVMPCITDVSEEHAAFITTSDWDYILSNIGKFPSACAVLPLRRWYFSFCTRLCLTLSHAPRTSSTTYMDVSRQLTILCRGWILCFDRTIRWEMYFCSLHFGVDLIPTRGSTFQLFLKVRRHTTGQTPTEENFCLMGKPKQFCHTSETSQLIKYHLLPLQLPADRQTVSIWEYERPVNWGCNCRSVINREQREESAGLDSFDPSDSCCRTSGCVTTGCSTKQNISRNNHETKSWSPATSSVRFNQQKINQN